MPDSKWRRTARSWAADHADLLLICSGLGVLAVTLVLRTQIPGPWHIGPIAIWTSLSVVGLLVFTNRIHGPALRVRRDSGRVVDKRRVWIGLVGATSMIVGFKLPPPADPAEKARDEIVPIPFRYRHRPSSMQGPMEPQPGEERIDDRAFPDPPPLPSPDDPDHVAALEIKQVMSEAYLRFVTYSAEASTRHTFIDSRGRKREWRTESLTKFDRSGFLFSRVTSFIVSGSPLASVIWTDGGEGFSWDSYDGKVETISGGVSRAAEYVSWCGDDAPLLLTRGDWSSTADIEWKTARAIGKESVDGRACFKVAGENWYGDVLTLWIERGSGLLLRSNSQGYDEVHFYERETTWTPTINERIDPAEFRFTPPTK